MLEDGVESRLMENSIEQLPNIEQLPPSVVQVHAGPDVYQVLVPFNGPGIAGTNCYVVRDGQESLVVDTGAPHDEALRVLEEALRALGVDRTRAKFFLTHFHLDHAGLIDRIALPGSRVYASKADLEHMRHIATDDYRAELFGRLRAEGVPEDELAAFADLTRRMACYGVPEGSEVFVEDGDVVSCGRWDFTVVSTPGHTVGHQSLFQPETGILFGGDLVLFAITSSVDFSPNGTDGLGNYLASLEKASRLPVRLLCHSHGPLQDGWRERAAWLAKHRTDRLTDMLRSVGAQGSCSVDGRGRCFSVADGATPGCTGYEATRGVRWNVPFERWESVSLMQRWAIVGEGLVYLDHLVETNQVRKETDPGGAFRYSLV